MLCYAQYGCKQKGKAEVQQEVSKIMDTLVQIIRGVPQTEEFLSENWFEVEFLNDILPPPPPDHETYEDTFDRIMKFCSVVVRAMIDDAKKNLKGADVDIAIEATHAGCVKVMDYRVVDAIFFMASRPEDQVEDRDEEVRKITRPLIAKLFDLPLKF